MAQPVVHFEVVGKDGDKLKRYYAEMFDWEVNDDNPMKYGLVEAAEGSVGPGIAGGIGQGPEGYEGHITFYVEVPDVEARWLRPRGSAGPGSWVRRRLWKASCSASSATPRATSSASPSRPPELGGNVCAGASGARAAAPGACRL